MQINKTEALALANKLGYFLKRKHETRLDIARQIRDQLCPSWSGEDMLQWLDENKPTKKQKAPKMDRPPVFSGSALVAEKNRQITNGSKFLVTWAQNNTNVHHGFLDNLKAFAQAEQAQLIVIKGHYNKAAFSAQVEDERENYDPALVEYLTDLDQFLGYMNGVYVAGSVNINPTTALPVRAGGQLIGNAQAVILGSPKQQAETLARSKGVTLPKWCLTTGAVTQRNYIRSAAGAKAESDHAYGAILIECSDESLEYKFSHIRGDDETGLFYHLDTKTGHLWLADRGGVTLSLESPAFVLGDIHAENLDPIFWRDTLDMIERCEPSKVVLHDLLDFKSRNHHNRDSGHFLAAQGTRTVAYDLEVVSDTLRDLRDAMPRGDLIVVKSNHDDALERWLDCNKYDPRKDPINAVTYHKLNAQVYEDIQKEIYDYPLLQTALAILELDSGEAFFLNLDQSFCVYGVEVGFHGHTGINGSRGTPTQYQKQGIAMVTGHTHSPSLYGDVLTVGCCNLDQGYNKGLSSWDLCHAVIYPNGTKAHIKP